MCNGRDKSDCILTEQAMLEENEFQQVVINMATSFINLPIDDTDKAISVMLGNIGNYTKLDRVYVFKHDNKRCVTSNTHEWCAEGVPPEKDNLQEISFDFFANMLKIWQKGESVSIPSVMQMPEDNLMRPILEQQGIQSLLLIPLLDDGENVGFVGFDAVKSVRIFNEKEITLLKLLAEIISNSLARQKAGEILRASEEKYRFLADNMSDIVWVTNADLQKTYVSPSVEAVLGFSPQEAETQTLEETATPESYAYAIEVFSKERALIGNGDYRAVHPIIFEMDFYHKYSSPVTMEVNCKPLLDEAGELKGIYGVSRDTSERKKAEAALKESEDKFRGFVENSNDIIYMLNDEGLFTYVSPSWKKLLGHDVTEVEGQPFTDFLYQGDVQRCLDFQMRSLQEQYQEESIEYRVRHKDGSLKWHASNGSILEMDNKYLYIGVARDITEKKRTEVILRDSEEKFRLLAENMNDIVWIMDLNLKRTYVSPSVETVLGFTPEESMQQSLEETVSPPSVSKIIDVFRKETEKAAAGELNESNSVLIEAEYYHKNGSTIWIESNCKPLCDQHGNIAGIYGVSRDISERKTAQDIINDEKAFQEILLNLSTGFINIPLDEIDDSINEMLGKIGHYTKVDRVYVFRHDYDRQVTSNSHEWCTENIPSVKSMSQDIPLKPFAEMLSIHNKGEIIRVSNASKITDINPIKAILEEQDIKSLVLIPLFQKKENIGFVGFDSVKERRDFTDREINLLIVLTEIVSNALARQQAEEIMLAQKNHLAKWNQILEMTVQERTAAVRNLLDNAGQGFLTCGLDLNVNDEYSAECLNIFGMPLAGKNVAQLLFPADIEGQEILKEIISQISNEKDQRRLEIYLSLLPEEVLINNRSIALSYKVIKSSIDAEQADLLMLILTDITDKRLLEKDLQEEKQLFEMVVRVVSNHLDFNTTLREYGDFCRSCSRDILNTKNSHDAYADHYRQVHTFKGAFHQFGMVNTVRHLHDLETRLTGLYEASNEPLNPSILSDFMAKEDLESWTQFDLSQLKKVLGDSLFLQDNTIVINTESISKLEKRIIDTLSPNEAQLLLPEVRKLSWKPVRDQLKIYPEYISRISNRLGKLLYPLEIEGGGMKANPEYYRDFINNLGHIFRNAVDHGIELPEERISAGKDEYGRIKCGIYAQNGYLVIAVSDDGRGLSRCQTEQKITEKQSVGSYSTRQKITELSGRGVGLAAVKGSIEKLGGKIEVSSDPGRGTTFTLYLPWNEESLPVRVIFFEAINIFLHSVRLVLLERTGLNIGQSQKREFAMTDSITLSEVTAIMSVRGIISGRILLTAEKEVCRRMTERFCFTETIDQEITCSHDDMLAELLKVITDSFVKELPGGDYIVTEIPEKMQIHSGYIKTSFKRLLNYDIYLDGLDGGKLSFAYLPGTEGISNIIPDLIEHYNGINKT